MASDGVRRGFDIAQLRAIPVCRVPLVASGGAGTADHFTGVPGGPSGCGARASVFHSATSDSQLEARAARRGIGYGF